MTAVEKQRTSMNGHLSVLVQRVHDDETRLGYASKEHLIDVCEFILSWPGRYGRVEYSEAIKLLAHYRLAKLANVYHSYRGTCRRLIEAERAKPYFGRCRRCGKTISNPISLAFGHGPICRKKLGIHEKAGDPQEG
ncbi:MAG: DUF6011 domain-containing protein [Candidatus Bathyarchaeia archaeon]|jgi:hypothetical protein